MEMSTSSPPGLEIIENFITEKEEHFMLQYLKKHWSESSKFVANRYLNVINNFIIL